MHDNNIGQTSTFLWLRVTLLHSMDLYVSIIRRRNRKLRKVKS